MPTDGLTELNIDQIKLDGGTQSRLIIDSWVVNDYAEAMANGDQFPPVAVYYDGTDYWLADGFHRLDAARKVKRTTIEANVNQGTLRDAILHSVGANASHGLRRTNQDKHRAVIRLLRDPEWSQWSDREIARRCRVSNKFVSNLRPSVSPDLSVNNTQIEKKVVRNGTEYTMNTANIGKPEKKETANKLEVWELERKVTDWLNSLDDSPLHEPVRILTDIKDRDREDIPFRAGRLRLNEIETYLKCTLKIFNYRKRDLVQACNNLLEQYRQQQLKQAEADDSPVTPVRDDEAVPGHVVVEDDQGTRYSVAEELPAGVTAMIMRGHWSCGRCDKNYGPGIRYWVKGYSKPVCRACLEEVSSNGINYTIFECPNCGQKKVQRISGSGEDSPTHSCHACGTFWNSSSEFFTAHQKAAKATPPDEPEPGPATSLFLGIALNRGELENLQHICRTNAKVSQTQGQTGLAKLFTVLKDQAETSLQAIGEKDGHLQPA